MTPHRCSVACSPFHPNRIWNWGPDDIHHHSLPRSTHSLPRSETPATPAGSILMKPLPGAGDNPHLQIWSVFFDAEPVLSHSAHFLSIFPNLTWFIKWVFGHTPVLLLVSPPWSLNTFFLVVMLNLFPELTDRNAEMYHPLEPSLQSPSGSPHGVMTPH